MIRQLTYCILLLAIASSLQAQSFLIKGVVYDSSRNYPLEAVSVLSTAGAGTVTKDRKSTRLNSSH